MAGQQVPPRRGGTCVSPQAAQPWSCSVQPPFPPFRTTTPLRPPAPTPRRPSTQAGKLSRFRRTAPTPARKQSAGTRGLDAAEALKAPPEVLSVVGVTLSEAQKQLLVEHVIPTAIDGSGAGRIPLLSSSWRVVAEEPAAGIVLPSGGRVVLTVTRR